MFRFLRQLPSLQRKLIYLFLASALAFLIFLVFSFSQEQDADSVGKSRVRLVGLVGRSEAQNDAVRSNDLELHQIESVRSNLPIAMPTRGLTSQPVRANFTANFMRPLRVPGKPFLAFEAFAGPENDKQKAIVNAFLHAWKAYKKYAWGKDELRPLSKTGSTWMGVGLTIVDSLDTLYIMGLKQEFREARHWVANSLNYDHDGEVQLFEMTIRVLGGLLSAYHLTQDKIFLDKAKEMADKFSPCFRGVTKVPCNRMHMKKQQPSFIEISTAESGSVQLEFRELSRVTGESIYEEQVNAISEHLHKLEKMSGLVSCSLNPFEGSLHKTVPVSVGAGADSYYEYLLKQWIQTGKTKDWLKDDYLTAVEGIKKYLLRYSKPNKLAFLGSLSSMTPSASFQNEMEHLACFLPGTLALGVIHGLDPSHLQLAKELTESCYKMYEVMPTGLSPESALFNTNSKVNVDISSTHHSNYNIHRPETIESIYYMYHATGDHIYREYGWKIFQAFEKYTKLEEGYASLNNVLSTDNLRYRDKMESFYLAETLKYLYLLFSDNSHLLPLDKYVFNTEAHPLPIYTS